MVMLSHLDARGSVRNLVRERMRVVRKLLHDRAYRLDRAERVGTGFVLPVGQPGLLHLVRKTA
jgi:hypothetical protein